MLRSAYDAPSDSSSSVAASTAACTAARLAVGAASPDCADVTPAGYWGAWPTVGNLGDRSGRPRVGTRHSSRYPALHDPGSPAGVAPLRGVSRTCGQGGRPLPSPANDPLLRHPD